MIEESEVVIIGAGISGLACAAFLRKRGHRALVLESAAAPGGVMQTQRLDGYLVERAPNTLLVNSPEVEELIRLAGMESEVVEANRVSKKRFIVKNGKLVAIPMDPISFIRTPLLSNRAKLRLFREPFVAPLPFAQDESVAEFFERRLGREVVDYAIDPLMAGVYAGDPWQASIAASFPKLKEFEGKYGGIIKGAFKRPRSKSAEKKPKMRSISFREGLGQLPTTLARHLGEAMRFEVADVRASYFASENKWRCKYKHRGTEMTVESEHLVLALPAHALSNVLASDLAEQCRELEGIEYAPMAVVATGWRRESVTHPLDGFGFLVPRKENRKVLGTLWSSTLFANRAPAGRVLLTTFIGGARQPQLARLPESELLQLAIEDSRDLLGVNGEPIFHHVIKYGKAIPQYRLGHTTHQDLMNTLEARHPGLHFAANYRDGVAVGDCIARAQRIALKIAATSDQQQLQNESLVEA